MPGRTPKDTWEDPDEPVEEEEKPKPTLPIEPITVLMTKEKQTHRAVKYGAPEELDIAVGSIWFKNWFAKKLGGGVFPDAFKMTLDAREDE